LGDSNVKERQVRVKRLVAINQRPSPATE